MRESGRAMGREFHVIETAVAFCGASKTLTVFFEAQERVEQWFEVALTNKCRAVAGIAENCSNTW
ncbi:unannotated protein [freshwater metagenome]|uniref:Unannotated protein n=1 Tax=freshwater metagenome TaxID=449393 RepID=A0A6J6KHS2_9ZZZZ